jgi:putative hemolysin
LGVSERRRRKDRAIRQLAWFHRWLGLATCVIFALWFASRAVLLFQPFPALSRSGQLALAEPVDTAACTSPRPRPWLWPAAPGRARPRCAWCSGQGGRPILSKRRQGSW